MSAERGAEFLDSLGDERIIPADFDWEQYADVEENNKVIPASRFAADVVRSFAGDVEVNVDPLWPWEKLNRLGMRFRPGEVTLYVGINGHFKSMTTGQIMLGLMEQNEPCLSASFEMRPVRTLHRMVRQSWGNAEAPLPYVKAWHEWTDGRLWLYDHLGDIHPRKVVAVCRYAARELGVRHFFIDSLMKCVAGTDDYTGQKLFVSSLADLAKETNTHVHVVHHARKAAKETDRIDKFSVRGGGEIVDQTDNLVLIQRNKQNEMHTDGGYGLVDPSKPGVWFEVAKQRDGSFEGTVGMWFNPQSLCLVEQQGTGWRRINVKPF